MIFQVEVRVNDYKYIFSAASREEFEKTTILEIKKKCYSSLFGNNHDLESIRVIWRTEMLEDNQTLGFYKVEHGSVLHIVVRLPGGGGPLPEDKDDGFPRSESMEKLYLRM